MSRFGMGVVSVSQSVAIMHEFFAGAEDHYLLMPSASIFSEFSPMRAGAGSQ
jgi:hypothetical protein